MAYTLADMTELLHADADIILKLVQSGQVQPTIFNGEDYYFTADDLTTLGALLEGSRCSRRTRHTDSASRALYLRISRP
jgi:hypothetical protein